MLSPSPQQLAAATAYCNCLESTKKRLQLIDRVIAGTLRVDDEGIDAEFVCLQLRRVLELLAFASISVHKEIYAQAHNDFATHWNAKRLLKKLENLHPDFYPQPVRIGPQDSSGVRKLVPISEAYVSKDDFIFLYDTCSQVLHEWNPHRTDPRMVDFGHSIAEWIKRIRALLEVHWIRLAGTMDIWLVYYTYADGKVHALYAADVPPESVPQLPVAHGVT